MRNAGPALSLLAQWQIDWELTLLTAVLLTLVCVGFLVVVKVRRWQTPEQPPTPEHRLEIFRSMVEQGLLDPQEFERIRQRLEPTKPTEPPKTESPKLPPESPQSSS